MSIFFEINFTRHSEIIVKEEVTPGTSQLIATHFADRYPQTQVGVRCLEDDRGGLVYSGYSPYINQALSEEALSKTPEKPKRRSRKKPVLASTNNKIATDNLKPDTLLVSDGLKHSIWVNTAFGEALVTVYHVKSEESEQL